MNIRDNHSDWRRPCMHGLALSLWISVICAVQVQKATAQGVDPDRTDLGDRPIKLEAGDKETVNLEAIAVTGTNIEGINPVGSDVVTMDHAQILAIGLNSPADVLRTLPQMHNVGEFREGGTQGGGNSVQGNSLNLRGIGVSGTLLLVDGRRVSQTGTVQAFTEANRVPLTALERIEVIADGASAVYGSDAVAGIVNYILRKDYEGIEATLKRADLGGFSEDSVSVSLGRVWNGAGVLGRGNVILTYEHGEREPFLRGNSPYLRQDLSRFGGLDGRLSGNDATPGIPGNIVVRTVDGRTNPVMPQAGAYTYYGLPAGTHGMGLIADDLKMDQPNLVDSADYTDWMGKVDRDQVALYLNQELTPGVSLFLQFMYGDRRTYSRWLTGRSGGPVINDIVLTPASPFYIEGLPMEPPWITGIDPATGEPIYGPQTPPVLTVQYNAFKDIGHANWSNFDRARTYTTGLEFDLRGGWSGELAYTDSESDSCGYCIVGSYVNPDAFKAQVAAGHINPLSARPLTGTQIATFTGSNIQRSKSTMKDALLKVNGPLLSLPGGMVRAAFGVGVNRSSHVLFNEANRNADNQYVRDTDSGLKRGVESAFAEIYVPVIGRENAVAGIEELSLSAAYRYDEYSDVGSTVNPKFGFAWVVADGFRFRGSWGTSFRSPNLPERNPGVFSARLVMPLGNNSGDPEIANALPGNTIAAVFVGSNADLKPEESTHWSMGFDESVPLIEGLKLSATHYLIKYANKIAGPNVNEFLSSPESYALYADYVHPVHNPVTCVKGNLDTYDPVLTKFMELQSLYSTKDSPDCLINVVLDGRYTNIASTEQKGIDVGIDYALTTGAGHWDFSWNATKILKNEQKVVKSGPVQNRRSAYNEPSSLRQRGRASWFRGNWNAHLFFNYTGAYTNDLPIMIDGVVLPEKRVKSWRTYDLSIGYEKVLRHGKLGSYRIQLNIDNLFDAPPPIVLSGTTAYNAGKSNPWGRIWTISASLRF